MPYFRIFSVVSLCLIIAACGGGSSSSGGGSDTPPPPATPPAPTTMPGEAAVRCLANVQLRRNGTALALNSCSFAINVRQINSRFPQPSPVTEIAPGQTAAIVLGDDSLSITLGACRVPSIPQPAAEEGFFTCGDVPVRMKTFN